MARRDLDQLGLDPTAIEPLAQDRDEWRAFVNLAGSTHDAPRGGVHETRAASRIFLRWGAEGMEAKSLEKENLLVIRIAKEST